MTTQVIVSNPTSACWDIHIETENRVYDPSSNKVGPWIPCEYIILRPGEKLDRYLHDSLRMTRVEEVRHTPVSS